MVQSEVGGGCGMLIRRWSGTNAHVCRGLGIPQLVAVNQLEEEEEEEWGWQRVVGVKKRGPEAIVPSREESLPRRAQRRAGM